VFHVTGVQTCALPIWIEPLTAARLAADENVRIHTIGIGADPATAGQRLGMSLGLELDEGTLINIADATGGRYFRARDSADLQTRSEERRARKKSSPTR